MIRERNVRRSAAMGARLPLRLSLGVAVAIMTSLGCTSPALADRLLDMAGIKIEPITKTACKEVATINDAERLDDINKKWLEQIEKAKAKVPTAEKEAAAAETESDSAIKAYTALQKLTDYSAARLKVTLVPAFVATQLKQENEQLASKANAIVEAQQKLEKARKNVIEATENITLAMENYNKVADCINKRLEELTNKINSANAGCFPGLESEWKKNGDVYTNTYNLKMAGKTECSFLIASGLLGGGKLSNPPQHGTADLKQKKMESGLMGTYLIYRPEPGYRGTVNLRYTSSHLNLGRQETNIQDITIEVQ